MYLVLLLLALLLAAPAHGDECMRISTQGGRFVAEPTCSLPEDNSFFLCSRLSAEEGGGIGCAMAPSPVRHTLDADGEPMDPEITVDTYQEGITTVFEEGDDVNIVRFEVDQNVKPVYTEGELYGMGALTALHPPTLVQFYADGWAVATNDTIFLRPGRHTAHTSVANAETYAVAPCAAVRAVSIEVLHESTEAPTTLPSGDQVSVALTVDTVEGSTLCTVTGTSGSNACLGPLSATAYDAGDKISARLHCQDGGGACNAATYDVLVQLYCY